MNANMSVVYSILNGSKATEEVEAQVEVAMAA